MPGPPPPPPPPLLGGGGSKAAGDGRGMLLNSIHQGVQLKKAVTNDRSQPMTGVNKIPAINNNNNNYNNKAPLRSNNTGPPVSGGLGGLFAGGMPKLKPANTGSSRPNVAATNDRSQMTQTLPNRRVFPGDIKNRGPPPQPPPSNQKPAMPTGKELRNSSLKNEMHVMTSVLQGTHKSQEGKPKQGNVNTLKKRLSEKNMSQQLTKPSEMKPKQEHVNKLKKRLSNASLVQPRDKHVEPVNQERVKSLKAQLSNAAMNSVNEVTNDEVSASAPSLPSKPPVGGHGKPNVAPKPPPKVARAQSLRAPRSPPVAPPSQQAPFPLLQPSHPSFHQSQDSISSYRNSKTSAPPPPNYQRTNPRAPTTRPPPPPSRPPPPPTQAPPPPPPHRTSPAPAQLSHLRMGPPPTPARNSSMRNGADTSIDRMFSDRFHSVQEFPRPQIFRQLPKVYNSVNVKLQVASNYKQQAPQPPVIQLGKKMYANDSSNC